MQQEHMDSTYENDPVMRRIMEAHEERRGNPSKNLEQEFGAREYEPGFPDIDLPVPPAPSSGFPAGEMVAEIKVTLEVIQEHERSISNTLFNLEASISKIVEAMGLEGSGKDGSGSKPMISPEDIKVLHGIDAKLVSLIEHGFTAQLSDQFDYLQPENMRKIFGAMDKRIKEISKIGDSYDRNLDTAVRRIMGRAILASVLFSVLGALTFVAAATILPRFF